MKKREFQKKATGALLMGLAGVIGELGENPNITVTSKYNSSYFKLRCNYNLIQVSVQQTGVLSYQLTDMLGDTYGMKTYYGYSEGDDFESVIGKFTDDISRLYRDMMLSGTLHGFSGITLSYESDTDEMLEDFEAYIRETDDNL